MTDIEPQHIAIRHRWGASVQLRNPATGNDQTERSCLRCGLVKVTVHAPHGVPWREWRAPGQGQVQVAATPPCGAVMSP